MDKSIDVDALDDDELRKQLVQLGKAVGPITDTTRPMLKNKLRKLLSPASDTQPPASDVQNGNESISHSKPITNGDTNTHVSNGTNDNSTSAKPAIFYAVAVPKAAQGNAGDLVFTDRAEAISFMKKTPGSRFKLFVQRSDAENFSNISSDDLVMPSPRKVVPVPESSVFRGPKPQELIQMRKLIEKGDEVGFRSLVWSNPRYLISNGDAPVAIQMSSHYNALHTAAIRNQPQMASAILDVIKDRAFMKKMFPIDTDEMTTCRMNHLLDLYLNMQDKAAFETPLHFACKYSNYDVVKVLLSQPETKTDALNKEQRTAQEIIGVREPNASIELNEKINNLFEDNVFVPLLRDDNNCSPAVVGAPWSPGADASAWSPANSTRSRGSSASNTSRSSAIDNGLLPSNGFGTHSPSSPQSGGGGFLPHKSSPKDPAYKVKALAGPMSPSKAEQFYQKWSSPPKRSEDSKIRCTDENKGLERVGRSLAENMSVPWCEYWDFLDGFADLRTPEGMLALEQYLCDVELQESDDDEVGGDSGDGNDNLEAMFDATDLLGGVDMDGSLSVSATDDAQHPPTSAPSNATSTPIASKTQPGSSDNVPRANASKAWSPRLNDLISMFANLSIFSPPAEDNRSDGTRMRSADDLSLSHSDKVNKWLNNNSFSENVDNSAELSGKINDRLSMNKAADGDKNSGDDGDSSDDDGSFVTAADYLPAGVEQKQKQCRNLPDVYISGHTPTKDDMDVLRILENRVLSPDDYPSLSRWKQKVMSFPDKTRERWTSPVRKHRQLNTSLSTSSTASPQRRLNLSLSSEPATTDRDISAPVADIRSNLLSSFLST